MSEKRIVSGLLDYAVASTSGEEFELRENSWDFVWGMGTAPSKDAIRWAYIGFKIEQHLILKELLSSQSSNNGRPKKDGKLGPITNRRAFALWFMARHFFKGKPVKVTSGELIAMARNVPKELGREKYQKLFPLNGALEQSVSRGKTALKINKNWQSKDCEKLYETLSQNTRSL